jgi:hypothetical protein
MSAAGAGPGTAASGGGVGALAHPARASTASAAPARPGFTDNGGACIAEPEGRVGWVFLEIAVALAIAVLIVWWTLPRKPRPRDEDDE